MIVMNKKKLIYNLINILVLLAATLIFALSYTTINIFDGLSFSHVLIVTLAVILVHFLKAVRLFLALYEPGLSGYHYCKTYCKVTPISILFPFKLGELFRMYCYGYMLDNTLKGIVTVVLDRFMDTAALLTMIFVVWGIYGGTSIPLAYLLIGFLVIALTLFLVFPGVYKYWKKYILRANGTPRKVAALKVLDNINIVYNELVSVSKGRGILLYIISLLAWSVEIGCVALLSRIEDNSNLTKRIADYLTSALSTNQSMQLKLFVFISVILMIAIYVLVKMIEAMRS